MIFDNEDNTGECPWGTFKRHRPMPPTDLSLILSESMKIATKDPDQAEEGELDARDKDEDDDNRRRGRIIFLLYVSILDPMYL